MTQTLHKMTVQCENENNWGHHDIVNYLSIVTRIIILLTRWDLDKSCLAIEHFENYVYL